jgi:hypothetical protein
MVHDRSEELARRMARLEARAEIGELAHHYCLSMDEHDLSKLRMLFTPDAQITSANGWLNSTIGLDAVMKMYAGFWNTLGPTYHWMHGHLIEFDDVDADRAAGLVMGHAETYRKLKQDTYIVAMRYRDQYRRHDSRWKFKSRDVSFLYFCSPREYPDILGKSLRMTARNVPEAADWPESLPSWADFEMNS